MGSPDVSELLSLTASDLTVVKGLSPPEESVLATASANDLAKVGIRFRGFSKLLVEADSWKKGTKATGPRFSYGSIDDFWRLLEVTLSYSTHALFKASIDFGYALGLGDFISEHEIDFPDELDPEYFFDLDQACRLIFITETLQIQLFTAAGIDAHGFQTGEPSERFDSDLMFIKALTDFARTGEPLVGKAEARFKEVLSRALVSRQEVLKWRYEARRKDAETSLAGLHGRELELLASRSILMTEKYGQKRVERIFEQKLALLFQSLGFTVIPARPGEAAADLLCIARAEKFSFLVDAKSTRKEYALPKVDQRALRDYAEDFQTKLPDLPSLDLLLLVGQDAAGTVPKKLEKLEQSIGRPVRFLPASVLIDFRRKLPGPVSPTVFKDALLASRPVIDDSLTERAKTAFDQVVSAYQQFVKGLRASSEI
jgi:hypothetical protein